MRHKTIAVVALLTAAASADASIQRYTYRVRDSSSDPSARVPQFIMADTEAECPASGVADGDLCYAKDTDDMQVRTAGAWVDMFPQGGGAGAPDNAEYVVGAANGTLTAERVGTNTLSVVWDFGTAAQAKIAFNYADAGADPALAAEECVFSNEGGSAGGWVCEGATADTVETRFRVTDPTSADRIVTIPNADSTTVQPLTCGGTDKVSAISGAGVITCSADAGGGSGDAIRVEDGDNAGTFTAMSDADFDDSGDINFARAAGPPDVLTATVRADSVALGTDTTGNYVQEVQAGLGLTESGSPAEPATSTVSIDYGQTLAGNPALNSDECIFVATASGGGFICEGSTANTNEQLYLFPDVDGADTTTTIALIEGDLGAGSAVTDNSHNHDGTTISALDAADTTTGAFADARVDGSLEADEVNPTLGTQTQGNFVADVTAGLGLTENITPGEGATGSVSIDHAQTLAGNPALNADECIHVATATGGGLLCEGGTANTNEMLFLIPDLDEADTTHRLATETATQTLTNKTLAAADNVVEADTGDSATGFFAAGQLEPARGGTGDDTSGTTGQPRISSGNWTYFTDSRTKSITIESPTAAENLTIWQTDVAITINEVRSVCRGTTPSVTWNIRHNTDRTTTTDLFTANQVTTSTTTGDTDNSGFNDNLVAASEWIWFISSAQSGTTTECNWTIEYSVD